MSSADAGLPKYSASGQDQSGDEVDHQLNAEEADGTSSISADKQPLLRKGQPVHGRHSSAEATVKSESKLSSLHPDLKRRGLHDAEASVPNLRKLDRPCSSRQSRGSDPWTTPSAAVSPPLPQKSSTGHQEATHKGKVTRPIKWHSVLFCVFFFVVLPLVLLIFICSVKAEMCTLVRPTGLWPFVRPSVNGQEGRWSRFLDELKPVKQRHKDLHPEIWIVIESQMKILLNGSVNAPEAPAIIVFLSTKDKEDAAEELVKDFATAAVLAYNDESYASLVGSSFPADGVEARKKVQTTFHEHFATNMQHVIVLEKFDLFPVETLPLFLNLMDHENAKYKDGVLIVTAHTNKSFADFKFHTEEMLGKFDEFVEDHFFQAWKKKGVHADTIRAVISRLSGSTIVLHDVGQDD